ncbi:MAG: VOC family protein [Acidimicrobiales bacterium]
MLTLAGLHHAALSVADLDASARWYADVLGLEEVFRQEQESRRTVVLRFPRSLDTLGLVEHRGDGAAFDPRNLGLDHLAFRVRSEEDLQEWSEVLAAKGVDASPPVKTPFGGMLYFRDCDNIALALFFERAPAGPDPEASG